MKGIFRMFYSKWKALAVVILALSTITCKKKKHYESTQHEDALEVVTREYIPGYGTNKDRFKTHLRGDQIEIFSSSSAVLYHETRTGEVVDVLFRKEKNGGDSCKIDGFVTQAGAAFGAVDGSCRLADDARSTPSTDPVEASSPSSDEQAGRLESPAGVAEAELDGFVAHLPDFLDALPNTSPEEFEFLMACLAAYLDSTPDIPEEYLNNIAHTLTEYLNNSPNVPIEFVTRFTQVLAERAVLLPNLPPRLLENLSRYPKDSFLRPARLPVSMPVGILQQTRHTIRPLAPPVAADFPLRP
jgi:hypothetical protein